MFSDHQCKSLISIMLTIPKDIFIKLLTANDVNMEVKGSLSDHEIRGVSCIN